MTGNYQPAVTFKEGKEGGSKMERNWESHDEDNFNLGLCIEAPC